MRVFSLDRKTLELAKRGSVSLTRPAQARLDFIDFHCRNGFNVSLTCRHFAISRPTFYRWWKRFEPKRLESLEANSHTPRRRRRPTWTAAQAEAVQRLRENYPRWGKAKLKVLLERDGVILSESMVGRILRDLRWRRVLKEPLGIVKTARRQTSRDYGTRKPRDYIVEKPGDLVEFDTLDVRLHPSGIYKHFSLVDVTSRWGAAEIRSSATATAAMDCLRWMLQRIPFVVRAIQVDGGSEFMADFEDFCRDQQIRLFILPPRSPKLNGAVERIQRTHTEEFYQCFDGGTAIPVIAPALANWEVVYNTVRPHQALGQLTPRQFLDANHPQLVRKEESA